jgi:hypothetical protein
MSRSRNLADLLSSSGDVKAAHLDNTTSVTVNDTLTSTSTTEALSANQGKTLMDGKPDNSRLLTDVPSSAVFTDTTYSVGDGGLTTKDFTTTLKNKLDGVAASANNYSKPSSEPIAYVTGLQTALDGKQASGSYETADATILKDADIGTTVLAPNGDGSALTNLPASGGSITATASGALANGDKVILNSDGTVSTIATSTHNFTASTSGSSNTFNNASTTEPSVDFNPSNPNQIVVTFTDGGNSSIGKVVVGTISGTTITFGSEYQFNSTNYARHSVVKFIPSAPDKIAIVWGENSSMNYVRMIIGTITGSTVAFGSVYTAHGHRVYESGTNGRLIDFDFDEVSGNTFVVANRGQNYKGWIVAGKAEGTVLTFGQMATFNSANSHSISVAVRGSKFVVAYSDEGNSNKGKAVTGHINGMNVSCGNEITFHSSATYYIDVAFDPFDSDKILITYQDNGTGLAAVVGTVDFSFNSIAFGTEYLASGAYNEWGNMAFSPNVQNKFVCNYMNANNSNKLGVITGTISGTTVSWGTEDSQTFSGERSDIAFNPNSVSEYVVVVRNSSSSDKGHAFVYQLGASITATNLSASNFIGISDGAFSDTTTATIQIAGAINTAQSGLTAGSEYWVQGDGSLATTKDSTSTQLMASASPITVFGGVALSASSLLIKGDHRNIDQSELIPDTKGSSGLVLSSDGERASWRKPVSGWVAIDSVEVSSSSSAVLTGMSSAYTMYAVSINGVDTNYNDHLYMRLILDDAGAAQSSNYGYWVRCQSNGGHTSYDYSESSSEIRCGTNTSTENPCTGMIYIAGTDGGQKPAVDFSIGGSTSTSQAIHYHGAGCMSSTGQVYGVYLFPSSWSFSAGSFTLYGLAKPA